MVFNLNKNTKSQEVVTSDLGSKKTKPYKTILIILGIFLLSLAVFFIFFRPVKQTSVNENRVVNEEIKTINSNPQKITTENINGVEYGVFLMRYSADKEFEIAVSDRTKLIFLTPPVRGELDKEITRPMNSWKDILLTDQVSFEFLDDISKGSKRIDATKVKSIQVFIAEDNE